MMATLEPPAGHPVLDNYEPQAPALAAEATGKVVAIRGKKTAARRSLDDSRLVVPLGADLPRIVDCSIEAVATANVFQRQGTLVDIVRGATTDAKGVIRAEGAARVRFLPPARLREALALVVRYTRQRQSDDGVSSVTVPPPRDVVEAVMARGEWAFIRPLAGIAEWPCIRPDGTVLESPGYDPATHLLYEPSVSVSVPIVPTREQALNAVAELLNIVEDFPFAAPAHKSAWLAGLLSLLARPAIDGPCPMLLIDASERGSGKTLLADTIGLIASGRTLPRRTMPETPEEWKKSMLAVAIAADPVILIDNVTRQLRSDALDAVLTGTSYRDRVLGRNEELTLDVRTLFIATANNASLSPDLVRRSLHVRLEGDTERPESRTGFAHADLRGHILENRARYLAAALTILRGYFVAGCPDMKLKPMGSFEAFTKVVRGALVWAGLPDPLETQEALRETSDPEQEGLEALFAAWHVVYGERGVSVRNVLADLADPQLDPREADLRSAINVLCDSEPGKLPSPRRLGNKLRGARGRIARGIRFERGSGHGEDGATWRTRRV
jgi:hypothetical protein